MKSHYVLGEEPVSLDLVAALSSTGPQLSISEGTRARLRGSVEKLQQLIARGVDVYGVTTGFGDS